MKTYYWIPAVIAGLVVGLIVCLVITNSHSNEEATEFDTDLPLYERSYVIFNTEDGTIDRFVLFSSDQESQEPPVEEGQVAVPTTQTNQYAFDIETSVDFQGQQRLYRAFAMLDDDEFIWLYNTYFASSDFVAPKSFSPQDTLQAQSGTEIYAGLQQALASVPVWTVDDEPSNQPTRDAIAEYYRRGETAENTLALLGQAVTGGVPYTFRFDGCQELGFTPNQDELLVKMEQVLGKPLTWYGMYTNVPTPDTEVPCAITNAAPYPSQEPNDGYVEYDVSVMEPGSGG